MKRKGRAIPAGRTLRFLSLFAAVAVMALCSGFARAQSELLLPVNKEKATPEIRMSGKLYYPVTRNVTTNRDGVLQNDLPQLGAEVDKDDVLITILLTQKDIQNLMPRTLNPRIPAAEADVYENKLRTEAKEAERTEVQRMVDEGMASPKALVPIDGDLELLRMREKVLADALEKERRTLRDNLESLADELGVPSIKAGEVPKMTNVRSPLRGRVVWASAVPTGTPLPSGTKLLEIGRTSPMIVKVQVYEDDYRHLNLGDQAECSTGGKNPVTFNAVLTRLPMTPANKNAVGDSYYEVEFSTPNPDFQLREGYKVDMTVKTTPEAKQAKQ